MIGAMRVRLGYLILLLPALSSPSYAQCAPAPDSPYFFRNLAEQRAEAKLSEDRAFYEGLLSDDFSGKDLDGKALPKQDFIASQLAEHQAESRKGFYAVRDFKLVEHRKGFAVISYRLVEGAVGNGESRAAESWKREVYEVQEGRWRLVSIENDAPRTAQMQPRE